MLEIRKTETYVQWIDSLRDLQARARIQVRIERPRPVILETSRLLVMGFLNYVLITAPVTGCTLRNVGVRW